MNLLNVRKGQFVYYRNKLHKVYSVKPFFKKSVHLIRLEDLEQELVTAKEITLYKPKHLDSFRFNYQRYTLHKEVKAKVGDYILIINPKPDSLDHHHLHAIEIVSSIEANGVISNKSNGIKHSEYWVMVPGLEEGATIIDLADPSAVTSEENEAKSQEHESRPIYIPKIGDVFQKNNSDPVIQAMVVAIRGETVYLGGNMEVHVDTLTNSDAWSLIAHVPL
ncbi:hypothetical protein OXB_2694 [Bacillus sp. OxB-1]|uniref:hypothetical protein n=1 Tax=Bacillus sp. (strain OxB-1) TaxID=98228 RepID=UPI000581D085|nr:hypothetical protein [Bacillus sp. OxB-1]BAQ11165.1 hypothetical protein OXB_2694 [Bacillus sp. OxB-1]